MPRSVISGSGLFTPSDSITNAELVACHTQSVGRFNRAHAQEISDGAIEARVESSERFIEIRDRIGEGCSDARIDDHAVDRDAHLVANAVGQFGDFTSGEFLGERNRKHERLVWVLEQLLYTLRMCAKRAGPHRRAA